MKSFANCSPDEFLMQVVKFRGPFLKWCENIGLHEIRSRRPDGFDKMSAEEKAEAISSLSMENMGEILMAALEKDPAGTKDVLCLSTFTEPEDFNTHPMTEYLSTVLEMLSSREVRSFFTFYLSPKTKSSSGA